MGPRPLRIARVIARMNFGGPARHVLDATAGLAPEFETTLFVGECGEGETEAASWIAASGVTPERVAGLGRAPRPFDDLRALRRLTQRFRELRPDVVHTHTAKAGALGRIAARRAGVPTVVHTFHGHVFHGYFGPVVSRGVVAAERWLARRTDAIVAVSDEVRDDVADRYRVAPREKIHIVAPGIDVARFAAARACRGALRRELGIADGAPVVAWIGRLVPVKDPALAVRTFERVRADSARIGLPEPVMVVVGDGPLRAETEALAASAPGIRFLGWRADVAPVLADADVVLLTSVNEGTPVALIEAASAGVPSVATRVGGVPSVVEHGVTGHVVNRSATALADAVVQLLSDPGRRAEIGAAARRRAVERYSRERLLGDLRALYRGLVAGRT